ncbi:unnamed protein product [Haemonchus placei]|uniref:Secreted protein n=1 Tax=Haemonchus placei TaxID=6290 RepID=A0A0N4W9V0_HAEPC|nr:unnamed protein product [Haemonchus placei]
MLRAGTGGAGVVAVALVLGGGGDVWVFCAAVSASAALCWDLPFTSGGDPSSALYTLLSSVVEPPLGTDGRRLLIRAFAARFTNGCFCRSADFLFSIDRY